MPRTGTVIVILVRRRGTPLDSQSNCLSPPDPGGKTMPVFPMGIQESRSDQLAKQSAAINPREADTIKDMPSGVEKRGAFFGALLFFPISPYALKLEIHSPPPLQSFQCLSMAKHTRHHFAAG